MILVLLVHPACQNVLFAATQQQCSTKMATAPCTVVKNDAEPPMFQTIWGKLPFKQSLFDTPGWPL